MDSSAEVGFVGLGAMGSHLARHLHAYSQTRLGRAGVVWNRSAEKAQEHSLKHGTVAVTEVAELSRCRVLAVCLPTTRDVEKVLASIPLKPGSLIIDCTSGDPEHTRSLAATLLAEKGVHFVDAPVSGGPKGAAAGSVTSMLGGANADVAIAKEVCAAWSKKVVHCGPVGSGDATKAINNVLNSAHLLLATEGLLALKAYGVDPATALEVINSSSGMSLQTSRLPDNVLSRKFAYGFALGLMRKDVGLAGTLVASQTPAASLIPQVVGLVGEAERKYGSDADYTEIARLLEDRAGITLGTSGTPPGTTSARTHVEPRAASAENEKQKESMGKDEGERPDGPASKKARAS
jgi:3-hydroxyisobutyrate dehydrogenase